jgi:hypothetical protein
MVNYRKMKIDRIYWDAEFLEVYYRVPPYWMQRVSVYQVEELINFMNDLERDGTGHAVDMDFLIEEHGAIVGFDIDEFHYRQLGLHNEDVRKNKIIDRILKQIKTKIK